MKKSTVSLRSLIERSYYLISITACVALVGACASSGTTAARGYEVRVRYAEVVEIERVQMPSAAQH